MTKNINQAFTLAEVLITLGIVAHTHTKHSLTKIILKIFQNKIFTISLINFKKNIFMI